MRIVGIDLGANHIHVCEIVNGQPQGQTFRQVEDLRRVLGPGSGPARVAFEACREGWHVYDLLEKWGHEPVMLDTTRIRQIGVGHHRRKNDAIDAEVIARAVESGRYPKAHVLSPARRELRAHLSIRSALVETRAKHIVTIRGLARAASVKIGSGGPDKFLEKLEKAKLPKPVMAQIAPLVEVLRVVQKQLEEKEAELVELAQQDEAIKLLATAPGVALIVAATFVSVIDNANRFKNAQAVGSYLGLAPSENTTGGDNPRLGGITKHGNSMARAMLVEGAWQILRGKDANDPLYQWGRHIQQKRGGKIAAVALARKLATILYAMWRDNTVYDGIKEARASIRGIRREYQTEQLRAAALEYAAAKFERRRRKEKPVLTTTVSVKRAARSRKAKTTSRATT
jgi:transposase